MPATQVLGELEKKLYHGYTVLWSLPFRLLPRRGIDVTGQDWDNLIVLDACRYDTFQEMNRFDGTLRKVHSRATSTPEWLERNFSGEHDDIVYAAGNPFVARLAQNGRFDLEEHVHHVEHVWDDDWDNEAGTTPPDAVTAAARDLIDRFPEKRLVLHYMQPHEPFIGDTTFHHIDAEGWRFARKKWWSDDIEQAYRDNLSLVLDEVETVLPELDGTTVITADHGELFGRYGLVRHPRDVFLKELYEVPWLEVEQ
ncbi:MAG: hypothetical protein SVW77_01820 [Candidatus Nanohaloarchaea archaeon]|nr:hypothetical protein [Candidatus Nanohaloarchaea archaeon]